jgi:hypothetical protein
VVEGEVTLLDDVGEPEVVYEDEVDVSPNTKHNSSVEFKTSFIDNEIKEEDISRSIYDGKQCVPRRMRDQGLECDKDLNYQLINYCELKFNEIWSNENVRARKWDLKQTNLFFRLVKQGSMLIYLSSHIFVLFVILMMSTIRQSLIGFCYLFFILWCFFKTNAYAGSVLTQREQSKLQKFIIAQQDLKKNR